MHRLYFYDETKIVSFSSGLFDGLSCNKILAGKNPLMTGINTGDIKKETAVLQYDNTRKNERKRNCD